MVQFLIWAPVVLLPLSNLLSAVNSGVNFDFSQTALWVFGAVAEELFYRFFLLKKLLLDRSGMKPANAVLLVSLLFAAMHLFNLHAGTDLFPVLVQAFCAFCFSVWAGTVVWKKQSLTVPLLAHVLLNLTSFEGGGVLIPLAVSIVVLIDAIILLKKLPA